MRPSLENKPKCFLPLRITSNPDSPEHHLDFFGQPPRVSIDHVFATANGNLADRHTIAQMKKTDRDKDWPFVNGLAVQSCLSGDPTGLLPLRELDLLKRYWSELDEAARAALHASRPLLLCLGNTPDDALEIILP